MKFRDRSVRAFSLLVLVAGSVSLVAAAGAEWSSPAHHTALRHPSAVTARTTQSNAAPTADPLRAPVPTTAPETVVPKRAVKSNAARSLALALPRSLPASALPAGTQLPRLTPAPANPWAARQPTQLGRIVIPVIGLDQPFFEGVDQAAFAHGVGHWPGSAAPGGWGNAVFGGHRTTKTHPFLNTDQLKAGDQISFVMLNGWTYVYSVTKVFVVPQTALWITDQSPGRTLTIFTCNPKGSSSQRLVTNGVLLRIIAPT